MSRQSELKREERESRKRDRLVRALSFSLVDTLEQQGMMLLGLSITYDDSYVSLVLKADCEGKRFVSFLASDTMVNVLILADSMATRNALKWGKDKYFKD